MKLKTLLSTVVICSIIAMPAIATKPSQANKKAAQEAHKIISKSIPELKLEQVKGNPVVAAVGNRKIMMDSVVNNIKNIPPQLRQLPINLLFLITLDSMVKEELLKQEAIKKRDAYLKDPEVKEAIELAIDKIITGKFAKDHLSGKVTDDMLKNEYKIKVVDKFPKDAFEADIYTIFVDNNKVTNIENKIKSGIDFVKLARDNNPDHKDGHMGFINPIMLNKLPVGFGILFKKENKKWAVPDSKHTVIKLPDEKHSLIVKVAKRKKFDPPKYSEVKPELEMIKQKEILDGLYKQLMKNATIFNPSDGKPLPPVSDMLQSLETNLTNQMKQLSTNKAATPPAATPPKTNKQA